ncbi:MAG: DUF4139 domain-containing protein [Planctomycetota bacterium]|jgi:uncharacterized protein (TIGR02231 family)
MARGKGLLLMVLGVLASATGVAAAEVLEAPGRVSRVTVYRGEALVSRSIAVEPGAGLSEVLVSGLPEHVVGESLFATAGEGVEVRAVRYRTRAVKEEPMAEARKLDAEIEAKEREIQATKTQQTVVASAVQYLDKLSGFVAPTAQVELTKGVLDAKTLEHLTKFILDQRAAQAAKTLELQFKERDLARELHLLKRKRAELPAGSSRTVREALLFIDARRAGRADITLSYLVRNAGWEPSYTIRSRDDSDTVKVEYSAAIHQMSGEDWKDVEVTLSTASPALMADGPELAPFWVSLSDRPLFADARMEVAQERYAELRTQLAGKAQKQRAAASQIESQSANWSLNVNGNTGPVEGMSVTYNLPGRAAIESRSDRQLVRIADLELKGDFYYVATPLLTSFVYRQADLANESAVAMLAGPAAVYRNGGFVGKSNVPMVAQGQKFGIGFGLEAQLRASREMLERTEETMGANRVIDFKYRLALENSMNAPVTVRLYDRLPYPAEKADIRVTPGVMTDELSADALYLDAERPKGILRWDVEVPARASGVDVRKVEYSFKMEFDRRLHISTPLTAEGGKAGEDLQRLRGEFEALNEDRRRAR